MDPSLIYDVNDNIVIDTCFQKNCNRLKHGFDFEKLDENIKKYILNRFDDSTSICESLVRIYNHIEVHPKCPICGKLVSFNNQTRLFNKTCGSSRCKYEFRIANGYKNPFSQKETKEKIRKTMISKYGIEHPLQNKAIKNKQQHTCISKYGADNIFKTEMFKSNFSKLIFDKYGVDHPMRSDYVKSKFNWDLMIKHQIETKRKKHTFNTSKKEQQSYKLLKAKYPDVDYQYHSEVYPFYCDFYIPSLDLYIECNYHWTHGSKPYEDTESDRKIIEKWQNMNSQYYQNAIECWTVRDINKRNIAKQNHLNWIEFWNINELIKWLDKS